MNAGNSTVEFRERCPVCAKRGADVSGDNLVVYSDGHKYCFSCEYFVPGGEEVKKRAPVKRVRRTANMLTGNYRDLEHRGITRQTCEHFGYQVGKQGDKTVHIANYYSETYGEPVAQKIRGADKKFSILGDAQSMGLFGQHLHNPNEKCFVTIVEGEIDAMSVSQAFGNKYAIVSVPNGAKSAKKALQAQIEWLSGFDYVVLGFDNDEPGKAAAQDCATLFEPGRVAIAQWTMKDPNEMLKAGKIEALRKCVYNAKKVKPQGIIDLSEITIDDFNDLAVTGYELPYPMLNNALGGARQRSLYTLVAREKSGKTSLTKEIALHLAEKENCKIGLLYLEGDAKLEGIALASMVHKIPKWQVEDRLGDPEMQKKLIPTLKDLGKKGLYLYDHKGAISAENVFNSINYMVRGLGCQVIILDNLSITIAGESSSNNERSMIDSLVFKLVKLIQETNICMINVVHAVKNRKTKGGEDSEKITRADIHGSGAFAKFSHAVFAIERENTEVNIKILANRFKGIDGYVDTLRYNPGTGRLDLVKDVLTEEINDVNCRN
jgi:twinkle protein